MGKKDITLKDYLSDSRRYADLWNGTLFQGKQVLKAEELSAIDTVQSKSDRQLKEIQRKNRSLEKFAAYQIKVAGEETLYHSPGEFLSKIRKEDRLHPVVTMVVYWGEEEWQGAKSLHDLIDFGVNGDNGNDIGDNGTELGQTLMKLVPEYHLYFLNLSEMNDYSGFRTELRLLFELYARRSQKEEFRRYLQENENAQKIDIETCWVLGILMNSRELKNFQPKEGERKVNMGKGFDEWLEEERSEGIEQGREKINTLGIAMQKAGRVEEFLSSLSDKTLQLSLLKEFHLA